MRNGLNVRSLYSSPTHITPPRVRNTQRSKTQKGSNRKIIVHEPTGLRVWARSDEPTTVTAALRRSSVPASGTAGLGP